MNLRRYFDACHKVRYSDEMLARASAAATCAELGLRRMSVYRCPKCRGWHATTNRKARRVTVTADSTWHEPMETA